MLDKEKNNFLLPNRLNAVVAKLSDKQAGVLFKGILGYADKGIVADFDDGMVSVVFEMAKQEIDYNAEQYAKTCLKNAQNGKLGGAPKGNHNAKKQPKQPSGCLNNPNNPTVEKTTQNNPKQPKTTQNNPNDMSCYDVDVDNDVDVVKNNISTAQQGADHIPKPKPLNELQQFAVQVLDHFEPDVKTKDQKSVWYKRNCRCLKDILAFCGKDIPLALKTIDVCLDRMAKAGFTCGYEAVLRNIPEYFSVAKMKMEGTYAKKE